jgi:hypothetical protein
MTSSGSRCKGRRCGETRHRSRRLNTKSLLFIWTNRIEGNPSRTNGDAYLLALIIHEWSEERCLTILSDCRRSGRCVLKELMISPSGPSQKANRTGVGFGMLWMTTSFGSVVITTPAARARSTAASQLSVLSARWMMHPSGFGSADPLAKISR